MKRVRVMKRLKCKLCGKGYNAMNEFKDPTKASECWDCFVQRVKDNNSKAKVEAEVLEMYTL